MLSGHVRSAEPRRHPYSWAGQIRSIRTGKGDNWFCYPEYIESEANRIFGQLAERDYLVSHTGENAFANGAAWFLSEINAIHPFREGNGRIQLVFLTMLARNSGLQIHERRLQPAPFLQAMIESFGGSTKPLEAEILRLL